MKAVVFKKYGTPEVLEYVDIEPPTPKDDEVLIRVHAVSLNDWDYGALHGMSLVNRLIFGLFNPKIQILGSDVAGLVEPVGKKVTQFRPGDAVFGDLSGRWGGFAELVCAPEKALAIMSPNMSFEQAAAVPQAAMLALQGLRALGPTKPGQNLLINGAGGGVGTFAIQLAMQSGLQVTAVDHANKFDLLRSLGAAHLIDYKKQDFTSNGQTYDLILDVKTTRSMFDCARALSPNGKYVTIGGDMDRLLQTLVLGPWFALTQNKKVSVLSLKLNQGLDEFKKLFDAGKVIPVIDSTYPLNELPAAMRHFGDGHHKGKVVIKVAHADAL